jgi:hypothetical protein
MRIRFQDRIQHISVGFGIRNLTSKNVDPLYYQVSGGLNNVVTVRAYMLELYQDQLIDLLMNPSESDGKKLEIKRDPSTGIVHVQGAALVSAESPQALRAVLDKGLTRRKTASTKMNDTSSRSHLIFSVLVQNPKNPKP